MTPSDSTKDTLPNWQQAVEESCLNDIRANWGDYMPEHAVIKILGKFHGLPVIDQHICSKTVANRLALEYRKVTRALRLIERYQKRPKTLN